MFLILHEKMFSWNVEFSWRHVFAYIRVRASPSSPPEEFKIHLSSCIIFIIIPSCFFFSSAAFLHVDHVWFRYIAPTFYYSSSTFRHSVLCWSYITVVLQTRGRNMRIGCISAIDINVIPYHSNRAFHSRLTSLRQIFQIIRR